MGGDSSTTRYRHWHRGAQPTSLTGLRLLLFLSAGAVAASAARGAIAVERAALHSYEDGPVLPASHIFLPGESVFYSCRLKGYGIAGPEGGTRTVKLSWHLHVTDPQGRELMPDASGKI